MFNVTQRINFGSISGDTYDNAYRGEKNYNGRNSDSKIIQTTKIYCPEKGNIADIGAGDGRNTIPLARLGHQVDAIEISESGREIIKNRANSLPNVKVLQNNPLYNSFEKSYDAIIMSHISQHFTLHDMNKLFRNVSAGLKQGGIFIFDALIDKHNDVEPPNYIDEQRGHYHFKENFIKELSEKNNFEIVDVSDFKEKKSSRGDYYGWEWGFPDKKYPHPREVKLKWFTFKKL